MHLYLILPRFFHVNVNINKSQSVKPSPHKNPMDASKNNKKQGQYDQNMFFTFLNIYTYLIPVTLCVNSN